MGALGSDTGGSVRIPASLCGIVGLKPTFGRVSRYGVYPLSWSFDTVGPMTRTVRDAALVLNAIAGHDSRDLSSSRRPTEDFAERLEDGISGVRIGIPREYFFERTEPQVTGAVREAASVLEGLGASVDEVSIPVLEHSQTISTPISQAEASQIHTEHLRDRALDIGADVRGRLYQGALTPATDYIKAQRARTVYNARMAEAFQRFDALIAPTCPVGAPKLGERTVQVGDVAEPTLALLSRLTRPFNVSGVPTVSLPCGFTSYGVPIGLQIAGRPFEDASVLRIAHAYEQATEWHKRRPPI
jgi:aspartyl-tRNA(Asn)/glutamyl-tRNA(Gln) amidotransferase subunit A